MALPLLQSKLFVPPTRPALVPRPHLIERLNEGLRCKLTLISAPAGFGKTTLVSEWLAASKESPERAAAWLSLDKGDNDPTRFLTYLVAALQRLALSNGEGSAAQIGKGVLAALQSPQPPPAEAILTTLLNEITALPDNFILVLDDYHVIDAKAVDDALTFLLDHLPPQMHLVIATREDPPLPLPRLRVRGQLSEVRATELRFTPAEAATFLNQAMGLRLSAEEIAALETRTEGWIAGLQLAAISIQGHTDASSFIKSFTGSHHFVMDFLVEEVLQQQSESVQTFLLRTSILDRLCGPLCDAVLLDLSTSGQETLAYLQQANLFIFPLDNERRWYRYHHLFADLLRQRLHQSMTSFTGEVVMGADSVSEYHIRASQWYEDNGLEIEAFHHATAANDIVRAERLIAGRGIPLHFRGAVIVILDWLGSLPRAVLDARPSLWATYASLLLINGMTTGVEEKLQAAEAALRDAALQDTEENAKTRNLVGQIAAARAVLALTRYQPEVMLAQSLRALEYLHPKNLFTRSSANWTLGYAYFLQGDYAAASQAQREAIALSQVSGDIFTNILATIGLGHVQEAENQLYQAAQTFRSVLQVAGDQPLQIVNEAHIGLARVLYEWNDLDGAEEHGQQSLHLARQYDKVVDRFVICEVFLARLKLAHGEITGASDLLAQASHAAHQKNFVHRIPEVAAAQVLTLLRQGNLTEAAHLAQMYNLPLSQARVHLAAGESSTALAILEPLYRQMEAKGFHAERLKVMVLQAVALHIHGEKEKAVQLLGEALALAEPGGFVRTFIDEGLPMAELLAEAATRRVMPAYTGRLLAVFEAEKQRDAGESPLLSSAHSQPLIEPLSQREVEVLQLIAQGLSNGEIGEKLFLALDTVKGHNRKIFDKLQVQRRTEAVARARELGLL